MSDYAEEPRLPPAAHEDTDATPAILLQLLAAFAAMLVLAALLVWWIYPASLKDKTIHEPVPIFPNPQLQANDRNDMSAFFVEEMAYLHGTGWVDRSRGTVHIPIEQAMAKVTRDGIADWPTTAPLPGASAAGATPAAPAVPEGGR